MQGLYSRRQMLKVAGAGLLALHASAIAKQGVFVKRNYCIGACDWSMRMTNNLGSLEMARRFGFDGLQLSIGPPESNKSLLNPAVQAAYLQASEKHGVQIASLALTHLNRVPYKSEPVTMQWVSDSIEATRAMGCRILLLAFFAKGDLRNDEGGKREVIRRLKIAAKKAERNNVILGIESTLSAEEHLQIIHAVGSAHVRVYYDVANSEKMGYDIYGEIEKLGTEYICEIHAKENDTLLGQGKVDFVKVKRLLDNMGYTGWLQVERSIPKGMPLVQAFAANRNYLEQVFNGNDF